MGELLAFICLGGSNADGHIREVFEVEIQGVVCLVSGERLPVNQVTSGFSLREYHCQLTVGNNRHGYVVRFRFVRVGQTPGQTRNT